MTETIVTCPTCNGCGKAPLTKRMQRTYDKVVSKSPCTAKSLLERGKHPTAINNRLVALESMGLVKRVGKQGKFVLWTAKV